MISVLFMYVCVAWANDQCVAYEPYRRRVTITGPGAVGECEAMAARLAPQIPEDMVGQVFLGCESYSTEPQVEPQTKPERPAKPVPTNWL